MVGGAFGNYLNYEGSMAALMLRGKVQSEEMA